ncbi:MAG: TIGR04552 family protein [Armatimonadetes bacterium]|nr:TIGR04552 family protein [Armatimonadota bacterium]
MPDPEKSVPTAEPLPPRRGSFQWDTVSVILEGTSPFELPSMEVENRAEAYDFLAHYGLDVQRAEDRQMLHDIHGEAVSFIRRHFLSGREAARLQIPEAVARAQDPADLLVLASETRKGTQSRWACAALRVMHTIHHANRAFRQESFDEIRRQIFDPYRNCLHVDELGCPVLAMGDTRVQLEGVFFKEGKSRDSIIMKLLHKPSNVAQEIYDWIGIQFVTRTRVEALLVVRFLRMNNLVVFANTVPGRSINNLIDLQSFRKTFEDLSKKYRRTDDREQLWLLEHLTHEARDFGKLVATANPFSGPEYRSIQFTTRQLIRVPNPAREPLQTIYDFLREHEAAEVHHLMERLEALPLERELTFFFPYEIQILDYENYLKTRMGQSSHAAYKKRQMLAARRRVLQGLL